MMPACVHHVTLKLNSNAAARTDVVVDRLWHAGHGDVDALLPAQLRELVGAAVRPVAANDVQLVDALGLRGQNRQRDQPRPSHDGTPRARPEPLHNLLGVKTTSRST